MYSAEYPSMIKTFLITYLNYIIKESDFSKSLNTENHLFYFIQHIRQMIATFVR